MKNYIVFILIILAFTSCGTNTDKNDNNTSENIKTPKVQSINITGKVVDGYIKNAKVCIDINTNLKCDSNETATTSDENGTYIFKNYKIRTDTFLAILSINGIDTATNKQFKESIYGSFEYKTGNEINVLISPSTDLDTRERISANKKNEYWIQTIKEDPMENQKEFSNIQKLQSFKQIIKALDNKISYKNIKDELLSEKVFSNIDNINIASFINNIENKLNISISSTKIKLAKEQILLNKSLFRQLELTTHFNKNEFVSLQIAIQKDISKIIYSIKYNDIFARASLENFNNKLKENRFNINIPKNKSYHTPPLFPKFEVFNTVNSKQIGSGNNSSYIKSGWALVKNQFNNQDFTSLAPNADVILTYKNNTWYGYSPNGTFTTELKRLNINNIKILNANDAFWVYFNKNSTVYMQGIKANKKEISLKVGWNLVSISNTGANIFLKSYFTENIIESLWSYDSTNKWSAFSEKQNIKSAIKDDSNITFINNIYASNGFWVYSYKDINISIIQKEPVFLDENSIIDINESQMKEFSIQAFDPNGDKLSYNITGANKDDFIIKDSKVIFAKTNTKPQERYYINVEVSDGNSSINKDFIINIKLKEQNKYDGIYAKAGTNDTYLSKQLYLDEDHLNILHLHKDYNGSKTKPVIQVVEWGIETNHPDLIANIDFTTSYDSNKKEQIDIKQQKINDSHGTAVAGIIAARGFNDIGVRGIVPFGKIAYYKKVLNGASSSDLSLAWAYGPRANDIDISNNSWGVCSNFGTKIDKILQYGSANLRDGKGRIYVMSAGNERSSTGKCGASNTNLSSYLNNPYAIVVAAMSIYDNSVDKIHRKENDIVAKYSNPGANILVSAYGSGGIWTTNSGAYDLEYSAFSGTSAAAPMVSGAIGLLLEACPTLPYRDVKYLLATTAVKVDKQNNSWLETSSNMHYSTDYGFGKLDITSAIDICTNSYFNLLAQKNYSTSKNIHESILNDGTKLYIDLYSTFDSKVEWVAIYLEGQIDDIGDFEFNLISPNGTRIQLLQGNNGAGAINHKYIGKYDITSSNTSIDDTNYYKFRLSSVGFLDEDSYGTWQVEISDKNISNNQVNRTISKIKLEILGY